MAKPNVNANPVANRHTDGATRIIEIHNGDNTASGHQGALASLTRTGDGTFHIHLYRLDEAVTVTVEASPWQ